MDGGTERIVWLCFILLVVVVYLLMADMTPLRRLVWAMQTGDSKSRRERDSDGSSQNTISFTEQKTGTRQRT